MQETEATMTTSRRSKRLRVAREAQAVDLVVDGGFLLDVGVGLRDVGLGLVVVVVGDEVLDRVLREEGLELLVELGGQRLVVGQHQRGPVHLGEDRGDGEGLAAAGDAQQDLVLVAAREARHELADGRAAGRPLGSKSLVSSKRVSAEARGERGSYRRSSRRRGVREAGAGSVHPAIIAAAALRGGLEWASFIEARGGGHGRPEKKTVIDGQADIEGSLRGRMPASWAGSRARST